MQALDTQCGYGYGCGYMMRDTNADTDIDTEYGRLAQVRTLIRKYEADTDTDTDAGYGTRILDADTDADIDNECGTLIQVMIRMLIRDTGCGYGCGCGYRYGCGMGSECDIVFAEYEVSQRLRIVSVRS